MIKPEEAKRGDNGDSAPISTLREARYRVGTFLRHYHLNHGKVSPWPGERLLRTPTDACPVPLVAKHQAFPATYKGRCDRFTEVPGVGLR